MKTRIQGSTGPDRRPRKNRLTPPVTGLILLVVVVESAGQEPRAPAGLAPFRPAGLILLLTP